MNSLVISSTEIGIICSVCNLGQHHAVFLKRLSVWCSLVISPYFPLTYKWYIRQNIRRTISPCPFNMSHWVWGSASWGGRIKQNIYLLKITLLLKEMSNFLMKGNDSPWLLDWWQLLRFGGSYLKANGTSKQMTDYCFQKGASKHDVPFWVSLQTVLFPVPGTSFHSLQSSKKKKKKDITGESVAPFC